VVDRFVPGTASDEALTAVRRLSRHGLTVTLDVLGEDVHDAPGAAETRRSYVDLLDRLKSEGLAVAAEVSLKLSAVGQSLPGGGHAMALDHAYAICDAADRAGTTVTLDMEDHTTVDSSLTIGEELRKRYPWVGTVLQANLRRTQFDLQALAGQAVRVRLVKGAYREPASVAYQSKAEVDAAYLSGLETLMVSACYPMIATHDPKMIRRAIQLGESRNEGRSAYELQMLYGVRPTEQQELAAAGQAVRVYVPFGTDWYGYFMRRLAERPANIAFFLRALRTN
jgi:proline dehydrogenase